MTIKDLEVFLERNISESLKDPRFAGFRPRVSLTDENGRRKRRTAAAENWSPDSGEIRITFEISTDKETVRTAPEPKPSAVTEPPVLEGFHELIRHLDRAESTPGYNFVSLKWFRDSVLPAVCPEWKNPEARNQILREAIERRLVLTSKVPNPKSPEFPVTALKLNRSLPEVQTALGGTRPTPFDDFQPIPIHGEAISKTVLRERR